MTLQEKAKAALAAREAKDQRWVFLLIKLSTIVGLHPQETERRIEELACP